MKPEQKAFRIGVAVLIGAIALRLLSGITDTSAEKAVPHISQALLFLQTGRLVPLAESIEADTPPETTADETTAPAEQPLPTPVFSQEDASLIELRNSTGYHVDLQDLLCRPLEWDLTVQDPTVLILHTHGTESYADAENYRSHDPSENMIAIGDRLTQLLTDAGIHVIHDTTMHDADSYNGSYTHARSAIEQYLTAYPTIAFVLDLHRDSAEDAQGNQVRYTVTTEKGEAAKLMLVMGSDAGGLNHPDWQNNLALAAKLHGQLEKICPDICRPMYLRTSRFNQDLCDGALLIEVGTAGNTKEEALLAVDVLAQGIIALSHGANL